MLVKPSFLLCTFDDSVGEIKESRLVNFSFILLSSVLIQIIHAISYSITFCDSIYWTKEIGEKAAHKMLVKLRTFSSSFNESLSKQFLFEDKADFELKKCRNFQSRLVQNCCNHKSR